MRTGMFAAAAGIAAVAWWPWLPALGLVAVVVPAAAVAALSCRRSPWQWLPWLLLGICWGVVAGHRLLDRMLPVTLDGESRPVTVRISGLPRSYPGRVRFDAIVGADDPMLARRLVRLSWYDASVLPAPGEQWRLELTLRRPRAFADPGGFDYRAAMLERGYAAVGYVRAGPGNRRLATGGNGIDALRLRIAELLHASIADPRIAGLLAALAVGDRGGISRADRDLFAVTGTAHLLVISGLHVGMLALAAARLLMLLMRCCPRRLAAGQGQAVAAIGAIGAAVGYAALAGFSLPTQRACVMISAVFAGRLLWRRIALVDRLLLALLAVLLFDPLAPTSASFWLSFGAIAVLAVAGGGSGGNRRARAGRALRAQWAISVGLIPVMAMLFGRLTPIGALVNVWAIPLVGLAVVPLLLLGLAATPLWPTAGITGLHASALLTAWLCAGLEAFEVPARHALLAVSAEPLAVAFAALAALLLLAPKGFPGRALAPLLCMPLFWPAAGWPQGRALALTVLDVGQGSAVVVRTASHTLVYDTGPGRADGFSAGRDIIAPYLRRLGLHRVDRVLVSHGDSDHAGGLAGLLASTQAGLVMGPVAPVPGVPPVPCRAGQRWHWDGVAFAVIHPDGTNWRGNNGSCVLQIRADGVDLLLTGDIERPAEYALVRRLGTRLRADFLLLGHHGSATSSSTWFLRAVRPRLAVASAGWHNRFGHPSPAVLARLDRADIRRLVTARQGAVSLAVDRGRLHVTGLARRTHRRYWRAWPCGERLPVSMRAVECDPPLAAGDDE